MSLIDVCLFERTETWLLEAKELQLAKQIPFKNCINGPMYTIGDIVFYLQFAYNGYFDDEKDTRT